MKMYFFNFLSLIAVLIIAESCGSSRLYKNGNKNSTYTGQLSDSAFSVLKQYLLNKTAGTKLKDTIIIKYDYNNETCWDLLDRSEDDYIMRIVTSRKDKVQQVLASRQNVSIFGFREPGNNLNKIKKWDNSIIIDSSKQLFKLLFKKRGTCGNSIIIMPDKRFVFLRSDPHSDILDLTQEQLEQMLIKNKRS